MTKPAHVPRPGGKRLKHPIVQRPAVQYRAGYFTALMRNPRTGTIVWPPGFDPQCFVPSTAAQTANGTAMREANRGHAGHGARPDGALEDTGRRKHDYITSKP